MEIFKNWTIIQHWNILFFFLAMLLGFGGFFLFRYYRKTGNEVIKYVALIFFMYRLMRLSDFYTANVAEWGENMDAVLTTIPFQLSSMCYILLPMVILMGFKSKNVQIVHFFSFTAGIVAVIATIVSPLSFEETGAHTMYESIISHIILFLLPIWSIATRQIRMDHKDWYRYAIAFVILGLYGGIVNRFLLPSPKFMHYDILFLKENILPVFLRISGIPVIDYFVLLSLFMTLVFVVLKYFNEWNDKYYINEAKRLKLKKTKHQIS